MNKRNYHAELESLVKTFDHKPRLLLHCCCAPCSSYSTEFLHQFFDITILFYNPNISEEKEYVKRKNELKRYLTEVDYGGQIHWLDCDY
ncbi:MAG: epoxyqueuosine reductase QueH, partial [Eubacterium sp.]|nr:epoxyqueuosine reductase QueH [Eubacterium sp.]